MSHGATVDSIRGSYLEFLSTGWPVHVWMKMILGRNNKAMQQVLIVDTRYPCRRYRKAWKMPTCLSLTPLSCSSKTLDSQNSWHVGICHCLVLDRYQQTAAETAIVMASTHSVDEATMILMPPPTSSTSSAVRLRMVFFSIESFFRFSTWVTSFMVFSLTRILITKMPKPPRSTPSKMTG